MDLCDSSPIMAHLYHLFCSAIQQHLSVRNCRRQILDSRLDGPCMTASALPSFGVCQTGKQIGQHKMPPMYCGIFLFDIMLQLLTFRFPKHFERNVLIQEKERERERINQFHGFQ